MRPLIPIDRRCTRSGTLPDWCGRVDRSGSKAYPVPPVSTWCGSSPVLGFPFAIVRSPASFRAFSGAGLASITWTIFRRRNAPNCEECGRRFLQSASLISSGLAIENSRNCYGTGAIVSASAERVEQADIWLGLPIVKTDLPLVGPRRLTEAANRSERRNRQQVSGSREKPTRPEPDIARSAQGIAERVQKNGSCGGLVPASGDQATAQVDGPADPDAGPLLGDRRRLAARNRPRRRPSLSFSSRACQVSAVVPSRSKISATSPK